ncbi:MAG: SDR family oxidoreductase [Clostridiales bacterium]|nr:SDR family oxidoreductase [Clostridiales bacterium]
MKNIIVTGGSRGIGAAIVRRFAKEGNRVILNYYKSEIEAEKIKQEFPENIILYKADVSRFDEVKSMCDFCIHEFGKIDVLINNAGIAQIKPFADITEDDWDNIMNVNLKGVYNCTKGVIDNMIHNKSGKIINISSIWGEIGGSCEVHYSASKAGIIGFTKALAKEMGLSNIQVNCVSPGIIDTEMNSMHDLEELKNDVPLNRIGTSEDIANVVYFLASDEADYITGQVVSVNGGM